MRLLDLCLVGSFILAVIVVVVPQLGTSIVIGLTHPASGDTYSESSIGYVLHAASLFGCLAAALSTAVLFRTLPREIDRRLVLPLCLGAAILSIWGWTGDISPAHTLDTAMESIDLRACFRFILLVIPGALIGWCVSECS